MTNQLFATKKQLQKSIFQPIFEMSRIDKLIKKLLDTRVHFTYQELEQVLRALGYLEKKTGKTSGSRKAFIHSKSKHIIRLHKPHPGNKIKTYMRKAIVSELKRLNLI